MRTVRIVKEKYLAYLELDFVLPRPKGKQLEHIASLRKFIFFTYQYKTESEVCLIRRLHNTYFWTFTSKWKGENIHLALSEMKFLWNYGYLSGGTVISPWGWIGEWQPSKDKVKTMQEVTPWSQTWMPRDWGCTHFAEII